MAGQGLHRRVAAAFATCLIVACSSPEERVAEHLERARSLAEEGNADEAILEYRSALKIDADLAGANEEIGDLLLRQGDLSGTFYLSEALRLAPERIDLAMRLARVLLITAQIDEAASVIEAAKVAHPDSGVVYGAESELLIYRNDAEAALVSAKKAVELEPENSELWMQLGRAHQGRMRTDELTRQPVNRETRREAIEAFEKADEIEGGSVHARIERARMIGQRVQSQEAAEQAFTEAVELAVLQGKPEMRYLAASAAETFAIKSGRHGFRIWALREMIEADPSQLERWSKLATLVDGATKYGIVILAELIYERPDDPGAHVVYTTFLSEKGLTEDAIKHLNEIIEGGLEAPILFEQLIRLQISKGQLAKARSTFVRMSDEFPDDATTARAEARIAIAERRNLEAIEILRERVQQEDSYEYNRLMALAQYRSGDLAAASDSIDRALELRDDFPVDGVRLRAMIHYDAEEWTQTLQTLAALAVRGHEIRPSEQLMRVHALYGIGKPEAAQPLLAELLAEERPPPGAAILFAQQTGSDLPEEARKHLLAAYQRNPGNQAVLETLVDVALQSGQLQEAMYIVDLAVKTGRAKPETLLMRARLSKRAAQYERAEADALRAFEADPSLPGAVDLLYGIYDAQDRLGEARASFEEAEAAGVLHSGARLLLCRIYLRQGEVDRAHGMLEKIVAAEPDAYAAKTDLALLLADRDADEDLVRALALAEEVQKSRRSDPSAADTIGYVYLRKGLHEAALQQFLLAIELNDGRRTDVAPKLHYHMGLTLDALGRKDEAAEAFEKALALDADFPDADDARKRLGRAGRPA
jgi:tetratricopeptide (TPR) repeat protein